MEKRYTPRLLLALGRNTSSRHLFQFVDIAQIDMRTDDAVLHFGAVARQQRQRTFADAALAGNKAQLEFSLRRPGVNRLDSGDLISKFP